MILTLEEVRGYIQTELTDAVLTLKLSAIENLIRGYTNNNFQNRAMRCKSDISGGVIVTPSEYFRVGDTVQISGNPLCNGLYVLVSGDMLDPVPVDGEGCTITKIVYPDAVKLGVLELIKWDIEKRDKIGISSETISRHSVSYASIDGNNTVMGFPAALMGFLKPYMKARF
jgi:hypothetical protein